MPCNQSICVGWTETGVGVMTLLQWWGFWFSPMPLWIVQNLGIVATRWRFKRWYTRYTYNIFIYTFKYIRIMWIYVMYISIYIYVSIFLQHKYMISIGYGIFCPPKWKFPFFRPRQSFTNNVFILCKACESLSPRPTGCPWLELCACRDAMVQVRFICLSWKT